MIVIKTKNKLDKYTLMYYFNSIDNKGGERENDNHKYQRISRRPSQESKGCGCIRGHFIESFIYQSSRGISEKKEKEVNYGLYCKKTWTVCH